METSSMLQKQPEHLIIYKLKDNVEELIKTSIFNLPQQRKIDCKFTGQKVRELKFT